MSDTCRKHTPISEWTIEDHEKTATGAFEAAEKIASLPDQNEADRLFIDLLLRQESLHRQCVALMRERDTVKLELEFAEMDNVRLLSELDADR